MGKVLPTALAAGAVGHRAGAGRRRRPRGGAAHARQRPAAQAGRSLAGDRPGAGLHADRRLPARARPARRRASPAPPRRPIGAPRSTIAATPTSISATTPQAADDFDASLAGRTTLKSRLGPLLWRYAAQVRAQRDARAHARQGHRQREPLRMARPDRQVPARQAAGRRARGRRRDPTTPPSAATASARPRSSSAWTRVRRGDKQRAREQLQLAQARCPTVSGTQLGGIERAEAALGPPLPSSRPQPRAKAQSGAVEDLFMRQTSGRRGPHARPLGGSARDDGGG